MLPDYVNYGRPKGKGLKLHLGCGDYWYEGFINIDNKIYGGTDILLDIREKLPFQDGTIVEIQAHDVVEHFSPEEISKMIDDWKRLLSEGGMIDISVPDIEEIAKEVLDETKRDFSIQSIYGIEKDHRWGYTQETFKKLFEDHGFREVTVEKKQYEHRPGEHKLNLRCIK